ncbi:hypothetical protein [Longimicrobium sp.]|jgi:hypothetical protein|uniref:hypothetical protein n=1 Tax=Longimicrobium sp. TaxID=2029185 RepID=UPI002EDBA0C5
MLILLMVSRFDVTSRGARDTAHHPALHEPAPTVGRLVRAETHPGTRMNGRSSRSWPRSEIRGGDTAAPLEENPDTRAEHRQVTAAVAAASQIRLYPGLRRGNRVPGKM